MQRSKQGVKASPAEQAPGMPETPLPDYDVSGAGADQKRSSFKFVKNFQHVITHIRSIEDLYANFAEPDPDYIDDDEDNNEEAKDEFPPPPPPLSAEQLSEAVSEAYDLALQNGDSLTSDGSSSAASKEPPMVLPKPLPNPCLESKERQALHKELILNYKIGKDILQKPELNKVLRERRETQRKKEWENKSHHGRTSLELKLEERANKMKEEEIESMNLIKEEEQAPEFVRMHRKITLKPDGRPVQS